MRGENEKRGKQEEEKKGSTASVESAWGDFSLTHRLFICHRFSFTDAVNASVTSKRWFSDMMPRVEQSVEDVAGRET